MLCYDKALQCLHSYFLLSLLTEASLSLVIYTFPVEYHYSSTILLVLWVEAYSLKGLEGRRCLFRFLSRHHLSLGRERVC